MARRKADAEIDLRVAHELSAGLIEALKCPPEKEQVFLKDSRTRGLFVRATRKGRKAFVFESRINSRTYRVTLGEPGAMSIDDARLEADRPSNRAGSVAPSWARCSETGRPPPKPSIRARAPTRSNRRGALSARLYTHPLPSCPLGTPCTGASAGPAGNWLFAPSG